MFLGFNGITWQYNNGFYQISINAFQTDETERIWTIFHEIGHVIDMEEGRLQQFPLIWKDREYSETIPWEERPWEKSAEKWAYRIWNRLMDTKPPYNKTNIR